MLMSKRRLNNLLKRKFSLLGKLWTPNDSGKTKIKTANEWMRQELRDISRLGGEIVVMRMSS